MSSGNNFGKLAAGEQSVVQDAVPLPVELALAQDWRPGLPHDVVTGPILACHHQPQHFNGGSSAEQGEDQWLDDAERASNRARVSPRFEVVSTRDMPLRLGGCFIDGVPERDRVGDLRHRRGEVEIGRGIEHRIAAQDDERLNRAPIHRGDQRNQRAHARKRRVLRLGVGDRLACVAEIRVEGADRGVDGRGLAFPSHDEPLAAVRQKVLGQSVDPPSVDTRDVGSCKARTSGRGRSNSSRERCEEWGDLPALETEPMISHGSRQRVDPFNRVDSVHRATRGSRAPARRETSRVTDHLRIGEKRVGVEGENHRGSIEVEHEIEVPPGGVPQSCESALVADGVVGRPLQPRVATTELGGQARQGGRAEGLGEDRKAGAAIRGMSLGQLAPGCHEIAPGLPRPLQRDRLRAVGIVEAEHGRLDDGARGPESRWVRRVSFDLGRSPFVALDDQAVGAPAERHGRRVVAGDPGNSLLGSGDKGDDLFGGAPAPRDPRERQRGTQQHHHVAPGDPVGKLRGAFREFPLERIAEFGAVLDLRETSPIRPTHRWHPEHSVGGLTGRARSSCAASIWTSRGGVHFMLVISEMGRLLGPGLRWQSRHQLMLRGAI